MPNPAAATRVRFPGLFGGCELSDEASIRLAKRYPPSGYGTGHTQWIIMLLRSSTLTLRSGNVVASMRGHAVWREWTDEARTRAARAV
jgi:hypothetical protein